jgi:hypothetical protein
MRALRLAAITASIPNRKPAIERPAFEQCAKPESNTPDRCRASSHRALRVSSRRPFACRAAGDRSVEPPAIHASGHRATNAGAGAITGGAGGGGNTGGAGGALLQNPRRRLLPP